MKKKPRKGTAEEFREEWIRHNPHCAAHVDRWLQQTRDGLYIVWPSGEQFILVEAVGECVQSTSPEGDKSDGRGPSPHPHQGASMLYLLFIGEDREHPFEGKQVLAFDNLQFAIIAACKLFLQSLKGETDDPIDDMFIVQRSWTDHNRMPANMLKGLSHADTEFTERGDNEKGWLYNWVFRKTKGNQIQNNLSGPNQTWYITEFGRAAQGAQGIPATM